MASTPQTLEVPGYKVLQFLGSGARSTIWQVRDTRSGEQYALKRVIKRQSSDARFLEQALNEYEIASQIDHPAVRKIHRIRRLKRWMVLREIHLLMEFCPGKSVQEDRPRRAEQVVRIFTHVAAALAHMNSRGFVHADTKPNNIIVDDDGGVKIIDLGQSCRIGTTKERIQGTPDFIAPEQVRRQPLDARTDVFNFGAALYWALTGKPIPTVLPREGGMTMINDLAVVPAEQYNPQVTPPLSKLIQDCIEIHPSRRPGTMNEVGSRLSLIVHTLQDQTA